MVATSPSIPQCAFAVEAPLTKRWSTVRELLRISWFAPHSSFAARDLYAKTDLGVFSGHLTLFVHVSSCRTPWHVHETCYWQYAGESSDVKVFVRMLRLAPKQVQSVFV